MGRSGSTFIAVDMRVILKYNGGDLNAHNSEMKYDGYFETLTLKWRRLNIIYSICGQHRKLFVVIRCELHTRCNAHF